MNHLERSRGGAAKTDRPTDRPRSERVETEPGAKLCLNGVMMHDEHSTQSTLLISAAAAAVSLVRVY